MAGLQAFNGSTSTTQKKRVQLILPEPVRTVEGTPQSHPSIVYRPHQLPEIVNLKHQYTRVEQNPTVARPYQLASECLIIIQLLYFQKS